MPSPLMRKKLRHPERLEQRLALAAALEAVSEPLGEDTPTLDLTILSLNVSREVADGTPLRYAITAGANEYAIHPTASLFLSRDTELSPDDSMIGEVPGFSRLFSGNLHAEGSLLPENLPSSGEYFLIAEINTPSDEADNSNNTAIEPIRVREPRLVFDGFSGVPTSRSSDNSFLKVPFWVRNDHSIQSGLGDFSAVLRLNDGQQFAHGSVQAVADPHARGEGLIQFHNPVLPVGQHEIVVYQSINGEPLEVGRISFTAELPTPEDSFSIQDVSIRLGEWSNAIDVQWTVDSLQTEHRLQHEVYWSTDPWLDGRDTLLRSRIRHVEKGVYTEREFIPAEELAGEQGYVIVRSRVEGSSVGSAPYAAPVSVPTTTPETSDRVQVAHVSSPFPSARSRSSYVDVWIYSPLNQFVFVDLIARQAFNGIARLKKISHEFSLVETGYTRFQHSMNDSVIDFSPYQLTARVTDPQVLQLDSPGPILEIDRPDLKIVSFEVPPVITTGSKLRWTVENDSEFTWQGTRVDTVHFLNDESELLPLRFSPDFEVTETLEPGQRSVVEVTLPEVEVDVPAGFLRVQLGQDPTTPQHIRPENDQLTVPVDFEWSRIEFELLDDSTAISVGRNQVSVRFRNEGPNAATLPDVSLSMGNVEDLRPALPDPPVVLQSGEEIDVTLQFDVGEDALGATELTIQLPDRSTAPQTVTLVNEVSRPDFTIRNVQTVTAPNLDVVFSWLVTNLSENVATVADHEKVSLIDSVGDVVRTFSAQMPPQPLLPGATYEASVAVPRHALASEAPLMFRVVSESVFDTDLSNNDLPFELPALEPADVELQVERVQQNAGAPTTIPYTIVNRSDFDLHPGQSLSLQIDREWRRSFTSVDTSQQFHHEIELQSVLAPGGSFSGEVTIDPPESFGDLHRVNDVRMRLTLSPPWPDADSSNNRVDYRWTGVDRSVVDLAVSDLSADYVDLDNQLVEATWTVTNLGEVGFEGPLKTTISTTEPMRAFEFTDAVDLEPGESITLTKTVTAAIEGDFVEEFFVEVSIFGAVTSQTEGARANDAEDVVIPIGDIRAELEILELDVNPHGEFQLTVRNTGGLPWNGDGFRVWSRSSDVPGVPFESLVIVPIDSPTLIPGGTTVVLTGQIDIAEHLEDIGTTYVHARIGRATTANGTRVDVAPSLTIEYLNLPNVLIPDQMTPIELVVADDMEHFPPWSIGARVGDQEIEVILDRDDQVAAGPFSGTAWVRIPADVSGPVVELEFELRVADGTVAESVRRHVSIGQTDLRVSDVTATLLAGGTHLRVDWNVDAIDMHLLGEHWIDSIYLSEDSNFNASDRFLESVQNPSSILEPAGSEAQGYRQSRVIALPDLQTSGEQHLFVRVNDFDTIVEFDAGNNVAATPIEFQAPILTVQMSPHSDTGWSDTDGITRQVRPEFTVVVPGEGTLQIDFDADGVWEVDLEFAAAGIHSFQHAVDFEDGQHQVLARFEDGTATMLSSADFTIDTQAPTQTTSGVYPSPMTWFRLTTSEPVYGEDASVIRDIRRRHELQVDWETPEDEFVVSSRTAQTSALTYEIIGVRDIAGNALSEGEATINLEGSVCPFTNPQRHADVNGDGRLSATDVLLGINLLERMGAGQHRYPRGYVDVNCSGTFTPQDPLIVINELARQASGFGEGESVLSWRVTQPQNHEDARSLDERNEPLNEVGQRIERTASDVPTSGVTTVGRFGDETVPKSEDASRSEDASTMEGGHLQDLALAGWIDELQ